MEGKTMKITVNINSCPNCRYIDHSGSFTPGGAKDICSHFDASKTVLRLKKGLRDDNPNDPKTIVEKQCYYWGNRVIEDIKKIPTWCPLKHGSGY